MRIALRAFGSRKERASGSLFCHVENPDPTTALMALQWRMLTAISELLEGHPGTIDSLTIRFAFDQEQDREQLAVLWRQAVRASSEIVDIVPEPDQGSMPLFEGKPDRDVKVVPFAGPYGPAGGRR